MGQRVSVYVYANDPILQAGVGSQLRGRDRSLFRFFSLLFLLLYLLFERGDTLLQVMSGCVVLLLELLQLLFELVRFRIGGLLLSANSRSAKSND